MLIAAQCHDLFRERRTLRCSDRRCRRCAMGNPLPGVATFNFGPLAGSRSGSTRIRLAKTQDVVAIAKMEDGTFHKASANIKVTIGGCGG